MMVRNYDDEVVHDDDEERYDGSVDDAKKHVC